MQLPGVPAESVHSAIDSLCKLHPDRFRFSSCVLRDQDCALSEEGSPSADAASRAQVLTGKAFFPLECNRDAMKDGLIGLEPLPVEEDPKVFQRIPGEGELRTVVKAMLSRDTDKRPTAAQVRRCAACSLLPASCVQNAMPFSRSFYAVLHSLTCERRRRGVCERWSMLRTCRHLCR